VQMPDNTREPSHVLQREVAASGPWADNPGVKAAPRSDLPSPDEYYDVLGPACSRIDIWHATYNHALANAHAIVEWFKGSALQPYLSPLDAPMREQFLAAYGEKLAVAYRPRFDGKVLLRFPRLFIVAVR
jgi:trans-aconitate 2-methyltransferase